MADAAGRNHKGTKRGEISLCVCVALVDTVLAGDLRWGGPGAGACRGCCRAKEPLTLRISRAAADGADASKKRPIEEGGAGEDRSKRANLGGDTEKPSGIKVSLPQIAPSHCHRAAGRQSRAPQPLGPGHCLARISYFTLH